MASFHTQFVRRLSLSACLRKPNIQRPRPPGTERRLLDSVTVPILPPDLRPLPVKCFEDLKRIQDRKRSELSEAYKAFRLEQAIKVFNEKKMIAICHILPMSSRDFLALQTKMKAAELELVFVRNDIAIKATENTKFHNLIPFFSSNTAYVVSDDMKVEELIKTLKKATELHLLGGVVDDRILTRDAIMNIAKLPPLDTMRGELLTILNASAAKTSRLLGSHQQELSRCLDELSKSGSPPSTEKTSER